VQHFSEKEERSWDVPYQEVLNVSSEPPGAKVYVQEKLVGLAPIRVTVPCGRLTVRQSGNTPMEQKWSDARMFADVFNPSSGPVADGTVPGSQRVTGPTVWNGPLTYRLGPGTVEIQVVLDGYLPGSRTVRISSESDAFRQATANLRPTEDGRLPSEITGSRDVLVHLERAAAPVTPAAPMQQQQQQQQTVVIPGFGGDQQTLFGTVVVTADVEGADVLVDGLFVGNTPANLSTLGRKFGDVFTRRWLAAGCDRRVWRGVLAGPCG
jgi:hypothetical protein